MVAFLQDFLFSVLPFVIILVIFAAAYIRYNYGYWNRQKIPYLEPRFPFGNGDSLLPKGIFIGAITKRFYDQFKSKGHKVGGVYIGMQPAMIILDPDYIKDILIRDFQNFTDRGLYINEKDPLSVQIFLQSGPQWKIARLKFTPIFTSARIKAMFGTMVDCSEGLKEVLKKYEAQKCDVDILEVTACFTTDVIGSCAFGIECNSFKYPDAEFRKMGRKFFKEYSFVDRLNLLFTIYAPNLAKKMGARNIQKDVSKFFQKNIRETVEFRERKNLRRNDFLQLLIDMMHSEVQLSMDELIGQVFLFFVAGFETSSSTLAMALFEISKNEDVQEKIRREVLEVLDKYDGKITYEGAGEMKYLGQAIDETLRLWNPVININRECTKSYKFQNSDITVEKGTTILIPALAIHHDAEHWPDPLNWDPDRFSEENKPKIRPSTYLPFGDGPRNCLGLRFGILQIKIALAIVLGTYRVSLSPKTITPMEIDDQHFLLHTCNKVYLNLEKI